MHKAYKLRQNHTSKVNIHTHPWYILSSHSTIQ